MPSAPIPSDDNRRLRALVRCGILDTPPEPAFDRIAAMAARICGTPIAAISLVDEARQWFKANVGLDVDETSRDVAFCAHAILQHETLVVEDAAADPRFSDNPLVTGPPGIRFYAGVPLQLETGERVGTLCVIDVEPRQLSAEMLEHVHDLASQVVALLEMRRQLNRVNDAVAETRLILDAVPSFIYYKDGDNTILNLNRPAADALCASVEDIIGRKTEEFFPDADSEAFLADDRQVLASGVPKLGIEEFHEGLAGDRRLIRTDKIPLPNEDGEFDRLVAIATDLTDLERAQRESQELRRQLRAIIDNTSAVVTAKHLDGTYRFVNRQFSQLFGFRTEDLLGKTDYDVFPAETAEMLTANDQAVRKAERPMHFEECVAHGDGVHRYVAQRFPLRRADGRIYAIAGIATDISDILMLQQELARKNAELERFVYTASHDLKTPIVTILGFAGYLLDDLASGRTERMEHYVGRIRRAAERMGRNIDDLLALSRIGQTTLTPEQIDLGELVSSVWETVLPDIDHVARLETSLETAEVCMDRTLATQVVQNLLDNAVRYGCTASSNLVEIASSPCTDGVAIVVRDHGDGIDPKHRDRIFGLFERLSSDRTGSGIGLAIVRRVAEICGGQVSVEETPGGGATFRFELPNQTVEAVRRVGVGELAS